jgi:hypothetical protein
MAQPFPISLLLACRYGRITIIEAAAIAKLLARELERDARADVAVEVPSMGDIRLEASGHVSWSHGREVPVQRAGRSLARILAVLVAEAERCGDRAPAALLFALARATDDQALVPLETLHDLYLIIDRFAPSDPLPVTAAFAERVGSRAVDIPPQRIRTVSDLRRARRDSGVSLATIASETGIPLTLLRELEWGLFDSWPPGNQTEASLRAYARAAGLPPKAVLAVVRGPGILQPPLEVRGVPVWVVACAVVVLSGAAAATWVSQASPTHSAAPQPVAAVTQVKSAETIVRVAPAAAAAPRAATVARPAESRVAAPSRKVVESASRRPAVRRAAARPQQQASAPREPERKQRQSVWTRPLLIIKFGRR